MDPVFSIIIIRAILAVLLVIGGLLQIILGFVLYIKKVGLETDDTSIQIGNIKLNPKRVGSVSMCTAFAWALCVVWITPNYEVSNGHQRIYTFKDGNIELQIPELKYSQKEKIGTDSNSLIEAYKKAFKGAVMSGENQNNDKNAIKLKVNNKPEDIDTDTVTTNKMDGNIDEIVHKIKTSKGDVEIILKPHKNRDSIIFIPENIIDIDKKK